MSTRRVQRRKKPPPSAAPAPPASRLWWRIVLLVTAGAVIYANSSVSVINNTSIRGWSSQMFAAGREVPTAGRPLVNASMAVNYAIGGLDVRGYHLWNIGLHLLCTALLFALVHCTLLLSRVPEWLRQQAVNLSLAIALLWCVHPLNSEVIDYITQRSESTMALAYLLTIYASSRAFESPRRIGWQALAVAACGAGMACKESMVTAPIAVVLYDATLVFGSLAEALKRRWRFYAALASTWLILAALLRTGARVYSAGFSTRVSAWTYLLNQTIMIVRYLRLAVWPSSLVVNYGWPRTLTLIDVLPLCADRSRVPRTDGGRALATPSHRLPGRLVLPDARSHNKHPSHRDGSWSRAAHVPAAHCVDRSGGDWSRMDRPSASARRCDRHDAGYARDDCARHRNGGTQPRVRVTARAG